MALKETAGLYDHLKVEWNKKNPSLSKCGDLLTKLKVKSHICLSVFKPVSMSQMRNKAYFEASALLAYVAKFANLG